MKTSACVVKYQRMRFTVSDPPKFSTSRCSLNRKAGRTVPKRMSSAIDLTVPAASSPVTRAHTPWPAQAIARVTREPPTCEHSSMIDIDLNIMRRRAIASGTTASAVSGSCRPITAVSSHRRGSSNAIADSGARPSSSAYSPPLASKAKPNTCRCSDSGASGARIRLTPRPISATSEVRPTTTITIAIRP